MRIRKALGIGHWALGIRHWALVIGHWHPACPAYCGEPVEG